MELGSDRSPREKVKTTLQESEERYREIFDNAPVGIFQANPGSGFLTANPALAQMLGYESPSELTATVRDIGKQLCVDPEQWTGLLAGNHRGAQYSQHEVQFCRKDGLILSTQVTFCAVRNEDASIRYLEGIVQNITPICRAEEKLQISERRYRRLVEFLPEAIFVFRNGRIILANDAAARLFRAVNPILLLGRSALNLVHPEHRQVASSLLHITSEEKCELSSAEAQFQRLDGTPLTLEISAIPLEDEGKPAVLWVARDTSERKEAGEAIHRQNEYLMALHETSIGLVGRLELDELLRTILTRAAALLKASTGFLYLYNADSHDLEMKVGLGFHEARVGERIKPGEGLVGRVWETQRPLFICDYRDWAGRIPDSRLDPMVSIVGVPLKLHSHLAGVVGISFNERMETFGDDEMVLLTRFAELASVALDNARLYADLQNELYERKRVESELLRAKDLAESANKSKSEFLASMSHELRTPLNAIIGFTELTVDKRFGELNDMQVENLDLVLQSSRHLLSLINDILDLAKVEAGRYVLELSRVFLKEILLGSLTMVKQKAHNQSIVLITDVKAVEDTVISADERKLRQIMYNLLSNAVKFTPGGGEIILKVRWVDCLVRTGMRRSDPDGLWFMLDPGEIVDTEEMEGPEPAAPMEWGPGRAPARKSAKGIEVSVSDTGIGIGSEDLERIFQPFEQAESPLNRRFQGTGLGLALTKKLVELHGGKIWAESQGMGKGSVFRFVLPVA